MAITLFTPLVVSALIGMGAPWAGRILPPRLGTWLLAVAAVVAGGGWAAALSMVALTLVGRFPDLAAEGGWSTGVLNAHTPVSWGVATVCAAVLVACTAMFGAAVWERARAAIAIRRRAGDLRTTGELAVVDDPKPIAFALPGRPGRIVVSSGMLQALQAGEPGALLAHERAHLRHRHHLFLLVLHLAAAVDPLLRSLATAGEFAIERWADEEAAAELGDRRLVARAVARAALASGPRAAARGNLAATGGAVPQRVQALLEPPLKPMYGLVAAHAALMLVCCVSLVLSAHSMDHLFDIAGPSARITASEHRDPRHHHPGGSARLREPACEPQVSDRDC